MRLNYERGFDTFISSTQASSFFKRHTARAASRACACVRSGPKLFPSEMGIPLQRAVSALPLSPADGVP